MIMMPLVGLAALTCLVPGQIGGPAMPASVSNVRFNTLMSGNDAKTAASGVFTFNEPNAFGSYWRANQRARAPYLQPDFFQYWRLVAIHTGSRPSTGYGLGVQKIVRRIDRATIFALESTPPRGSRNVQMVTSPWVLLKVERGAFDFALETRQFAGYAGAQSGQAGTTMQVGGATVTFGPGYSDCDHCRHRGRGSCHCDKGARNCDCGN